ncbi:MAG: hypothetical protein K0R58_1956, partial [Ramlibacter sp.]|nr:hypothetical protein [Ramlibacter sp.]
MPTPRRHLLSRFALMACALAAPLAPAAAQAQDTFPS